MRTFHVKKGDEAVIISGADKGKRGRVIAVIGKKARVIIEGAHMILSLIHISWTSGREYQGPV